jgi:DNA-directed RNA polymerase specialized sigma24 family protein
LDRQADIGALDRERMPSLARIFADDEAFRDWYDATMPRIYRYLYHRSGRRQDLAEELTQQVFVEAVRSRPQFAGGDVVGWLIGIARHRLVDHFAASSDANAASSG